MNVHLNSRLAWNAAYWLLKSEARRQRDARFPDCDWTLVEADEEWVAAVIEAQTRLCRQAMGSALAGRQRLA